ncbi:MAG: Ig domain-containing protein [Solobacterium sp.]|nr:Ig domain-containing protein [Solobacterium sp.]
MKRLQSLLLCLLAVCLCGIPAKAEEAPPEFTWTNTNSQDYDRWATTVNSYLVPDGNGWMVLDMDPSKGVRALYYDSSYVLKNYVSIPVELPIFGGFYAADDAYYIVSGQKNPTESDSVECFRITKYDRNWKRLGSDGLKACNTYIPFDAGSCRIAKDGKYLVIRTAHEMYADESGTHHQANVTIQFDADAMKITDSYTGIMNINYGYVSHSFNQFILTDNDHIVAVDHGDAHPRSAVLIKYNAAVSSGKFMNSYPVVNYRNLLTFAGEVGNNTTNASIGGFARSSTHYLVLGNASDQSEYGNKTRNIFVAAADKNLSSSSVYWLTSLPKTSNKELSTPHLVDLGNDTFLAMWMPYRERKEYYDSFLAPADVSYVILDNQGKAISEICHVDALLSDCVPVVKNGKVYWYVHEKSLFTFYELDPKKNELTTKLGKTGSWVTAEAISINPDEAIFCAGQKREFSASISPENATDRRYIMEIVDPVIAHFNGSVLIADNEGETDVTVRTAEGLTDTCHIKVYEELKTYTIPDLYQTMYVNEQTTWDVKLTPESLRRIIQFRSEDPSVISIDDNGVITALKVGETSVSCAIGQVKKTCRIRVNILEVTSIQMDSRMELRPDESKTLSVRFLPENATDKTLKWTSDNPSVAAVDANGTVKGIAPGKAVIKAETTNGKTASCTVTVVPLDPESITLNESSLSLKPSETFDLKAAVKPDNSDQTVTWSSDNTSIARVDTSGKVTAVSPGKAIITAATANGLKATCTITVTGIEAESITISRSEVSMKPGEGTQLTVTIKPDNTTDKTVTWKSDNSDIVTVDAHGNIKCVKPGKAVITAATANGLTASCTVTVRAVEATYITLNKTTMELTEGDTDTLQAAIKPNDTTDKSVTWTSNHPEIATVDAGGKVTAVKEGTAVITVSTVNGITAECRVTVTKKDSGDPAACTVNGFCHYNGKDYWYEDGKRQGVYNDPKCFSSDGSLRGREIYDPKTDGWYWLDVIYDGAKAVEKEVYMPYIYQDEADHLRDDAWINAVAALSTRTSPETSTCQPRLSRPSNSMAARVPASGCAMTKTAA